MLFMRTIRSPQLPGYTNLRFAVYRLKGKFKLIMVIINGKSHTDTAWCFLNYLWLVNKCGVICSLSKVGSTTAKDRNLCRYML